MAASCFGSMWPAWSPPKISRATSPGMTRMITNTRAAAPSSVGMIDVVERAADDELEASGVPSIREPGGRLERPVLGLDADLAPLLDREDGEVLVGNLDVTVF